LGFRFIVLGLAWNLSRKPVRDIFAVLAMANGNESGRQKMIKE
jgi:hypothetical protein